ncbi:hypothetical protein B0T16DRAFT_395735 [Cercophora newfieldiana]|uniref:F-box domain-containing protein n=1 Tax=Cercophora newfieldiana TaxID=92897 RepID=A0AA40CXB5_9PEZI|nr:hypothetical protein B0T16DRAFT_395735 [Cercophora newfieldiana]
MTMESAARRAFGIFELLEAILLQLGDPVTITRLRPVSRAWRDVIDSSPALQVACWYRHDPSLDPSDDAPAQDQQCKLNPALTALGFTITMQGDQVQWGVTDDFIVEKGEEDEDEDWILTRQSAAFSFMKRVYDKPGPWTAMLATRPPCRRIEIRCSEKEWFGVDHGYFVVSAPEDGPILLGDILAILAECQHRLEAGLDQHPGTRYLHGSFVGVPDNKDPELQGFDFYHRTLYPTPHDVSIKVAVWHADNAPAFSLRRLHHPQTKKSPNPLHEMTIHKIFEYQHMDRGFHLGPSRRYSRDRARKGLRGVEGKYGANLVAVRSYKDKSGYLGAWKHIYRLLPADEESQEPVRAQFV